MAEPVVIVVSPAALAMAEKAAQALGAELHGLSGRIDKADYLFQDTAAHLQGLFLAERPIIGVCASGILIRALAPVLEDKQTEPPVLAVAYASGDVVPLLGGHHGANMLAEQLAKALGGAKAVITTGSHQSLPYALDEPPAGWRLVNTNPDDVKRAMAALLAGAEASLEGLAPSWLQELASVTKPTEDSSAWMASLHIAGVAQPICYAPSCLTLGVGCERGADPAELATLLETVLTTHNLPQQALAGVFSLDLKSNEAAVQALAAQLDVPARFFLAEELKAQTDRLQTPSEIVFQEVGCHGVSEAAALAAAGADAALVVPKQKSKRCTVAIAQAPAALTVLPGKARGRLHVVGLGPGAADMRSYAADQAVLQAEEIVGYRYYVDLLPMKQRQKARKAFALGEEEARCRYALERAAEGRSVALVCSGDGGIYAMGALVMELLNRPQAAGGVSEAAHRVEVIHHPGITAMQTASARAGALLGHDFCAISLSDLLTPWETIEQRLQAAAAGDFVIGFYNPVSQKRRTQLARAQEILLAHRPGNTPVLLGRHLGRPEESLRYCTLENLTVDMVDMMTVVLVGSSQSRVFTSGDLAAGAGGQWLYTPRGYAKKLQEIN